MTNKINLNTFLWVRQEQFKKTGKENTMKKSDDHIMYDRLKERQRIALVSFYTVWEKEQEVQKELQEQIEESYDRIRRMENDVEDIRHHVEDHYKNCLTRTDKKKIQEETS